MKASSNQIFDAAVKLIAARVSAQQGIFAMISEDDIRLSVAIAESIADEVEDDSVMTLSVDHIKDVMVKCYENHKSKEMPMTLLIENVKAVDNVSRATAVAIIQRAEQSEFVKSELKGKKTIYTFTKRVTVPDTESDEDDPSPF